MAKCMWWCIHNLPLWRFVPFHVSTEINCCSFVLCLIWKLNNEWYWYCHWLSILKLKLLLKMMVLFKIIIYFTRCAYQKAHVGQTCWHKIITTDCSQLIFNRLFIRLIDKSCIALSMNSSISSSVYRTQSNQKRKWSHRMNTKDLWIFNIFFLLFGDENGNFIDFAAFIYLYLFQYLVELVFWPASINQRS